MKQIIKINKCKECTEKSCAVSVLNNSELEMISRNSSQVKFQKNEMIFKQDSPASFIIFVNNGIVKEHMTGPNKKEQILKIVKGPAFLRISSKLKYNNNSYSATAITDSTICFINIDVFKELIYNNPKFGYEVLISVCEDGLYCFNKFVNQTQKQVPGRLAEALLFFSNEIYNKDKFIFPVSKNELADLIGSTRESVTRTLSAFKHEHIIGLSGKSVEILNKNILEQISKTG
jgi:CRP-like cAMP-binding protein